MKTNTKTSQGLVPFLSCFFLTFALTAGGIFCLVTAFDLPVDTVSLPLILAAWCGAAAAGKIMCGLAHCHTGHGPVRHGKKRG